MSASAGPTRRSAPEAEERVPEAAQAPPEADPRLLAMLGLQQTAGNAAVARMLAQEREQVTAAPQQQIQRGLWDDITGAVSGAASWVADTASDAASAVGGAVSDAAGWVADVATSAWDGLSGAAKAAWEGISSAAAFFGRWGMN